MDIKKKNDESLFEWQLRLCLGKLNKEIDIGWQEIVDLLGLDVHPDHIRKVSYGYQEFSNYIDEKQKDQISDNEILKELENKKIEIQKEKEKIKTLRLDMNRIVRETAREELLYEEFINVLKNLNKVEVPKFKPLKVQNGYKKYVLSFADSHFGKEFKSITNEYNLDIVYDRFNKLLSEVVDIVNNENIENLTILCLGDVIEGFCLRISQLTSLKIGLVEQTTKFMRFMVSWLNELSKYVRIEYYHANYSNHSQVRPFGTKANDFVSEDMEKVIYTYIYDMLKSNERINIIKCEEKHIIFKIFQYNIIACHGHDIRNINGFLKDISNKYRIFFDYGFFAHKHNSGIRAVGEGTTNNCEIINVPSIMGTDDYADSLLVGSKAGALLIEFNKNQGKRKTYDIILN